MTVQQNVLQMPERVHAADQCLDPISLETIELIQKALAGILRSARGSASDRAAEEAGRIEYDSWLPRSH